MLWLRGAVLAALLGVMVTSSVAAIIAVDPNAPAPLAGQPFLISAVPFGADTTFIELHNPHDNAVNLDGYSVVLEYKNGSVQVVSLPNIYLLGDSFMTLSNGAFVSNADASYAIPVQSAVLYKVSIKDHSGNTSLQLVIDGPTATRYTWLQRKSGEAGLDIFQANMTQKEMPVLPRGLGTYLLPAAIPSVQIVEILASHATCAPNDISLVCGDYVKFYNPSDAAVDLSSFRLRSDSGTSLSGNAFSLPYIIPAKSYMTISTRDDGDPISLTNDGGYVWLEDAEGVKRFDETIISYPDASSTTKVGWSWALDRDNIWKWTSTPQPDEANLITLPSSVQGTSTELAECPAGKYRNPDTNRCRNIEEAIATLTACEEGKERNPLTNRCRNVATLATAVLAPCDEGQERNPATNRCRQIASAESSLKPCDEGYERNSETNRCRKMISSLAGSITDPPAETNSSPTWYWLGGAVLLGAVGYGVYEWRTEIARAFRRFIPLGK